MTFWNLLELVGVSINHYWWILPIILSLLEVSKIKINPWSWIWNKLKELLGIKTLTDEVKNLKDQMSEKTAIDCRTRILRFGDEIKNDVRHSQKYFEQIIDDIDYYEKYCDENKNFKNGNTVTAIEIIKEIYKKCLKENDFL